ncbi:pseudouridine synthase, RluA family [Desulfitobacterium dichloroeliminans LMG P-21439]|uniref:Pseudouridine synthase n=1 Tax=Desulfitobacterium dichloroeliminans (strain LMG P-21439 / DCA1) TaxID=871963 RepID=L0F7C3_DESDL|nr:RluA family pseudouridine synthase [Desulfitobacterium dichloroeliminans]AGA69072.1 pseudouridine synthase, RluA family [Desulfitobacterium dichloroeliminans LMG P-21439]
MKEQTDLWTYILQPQDEGLKYQEILYRRFHFSRRLLQKLKHSERVWVDGVFTFLTARGKAGETLAVQLQTPESNSFPGEDLPLEILFEDDYFLAVNKPAGRVVHPNPRYPTGTIGNAVIGYWLAKGESRPFRPIHRIDRNTSGVVVVAKNQFAHQQMFWQHNHQRIHKRYLGVVEGQVLEDQGTINAPIGHTPGSYLVRQISPDGAPAVTHYRVLKRYADATLLEFVLETGRTHQIRVHCQHLGHPLFGDDFYGGNIARFDRQALHAFIYEFNHPVTGELLTIRAPLPEDLRLLLRSLIAKS